MNVATRLAWVILPAATMVLPAFSASKAAPEVVSITMSPQQQAAAAQFWTRANIAKARPLMLIDRGPSSVDTSALDDSAFTLNPAVGW